ncbi:MAG: methyl-accepting chemotaxis protein [Gammaproteobacteria bacterium]|nr:MAG: methyl-accepting chemotaxis protein [Gammaproteobacteria bacterium]
MENRRKTVVINSRFQYQYALVAAAASVLLINLFIIVSTLMPDYHGFLLNGWHTLIVAVIEILLIVGVWWGSLLASHRIAGPVYVFVRELEALSEGDFTTRINLRRQDLFHPEAEAINQSIDILQKRLHRLKDIVAEIERQPGGYAPATPDHLARLKAELEQFKTA